MTPLQLSNAVLEGESAKAFFKKLMLRSVPFCVDIPEWNSLEDWQKWAFKEMAEHVEAGWELAGSGGVRETDLALDDYDDTTLRVSLGPSEWIVYADYSAAEADARERVRSALDEGILSTEYVERYINTERLARDLHADVCNSEEENFRQMYRSDEKRRDALIEQGYLDEADFFTEDGEELEITGELESKIERAIEEYADASADRLLRDPVGYLQDIYGKEEGIQQAMDIGGLNRDALVDDALAEDGLGIWLSPYDGDTIELEHGAVAFRIN